MAWRDLVRKYEEGWALNSDSEVTLVFLLTSSCSCFTVWQGGSGLSRVRNNGPTSHLDSFKSFKEMGRVPMSAGFSAVGMYLHWLGAESFRI